MVSRRRELFQPLAALAKPVFARRENQHARRVRYPENAERAHARL